MTEAGNAAQARLVAMADPPAPEDLRVEFAAFVDGDVRRFIDDGLNFHSIAVTGLPNFLPVNFLLRGACGALALFLGLCGRLLGLGPRCQTEAEHASDDAHPVKQKAAGPGSRHDQNPLSLLSQGSSRAPSVPSCTANTSCRHSTYHLGQNRSVGKFPNIPAHSPRISDASLSASSPWRHTGRLAIVRTWNGATLVNGLPVFENNEAPEGLSSPGLRMMQQLVPEIGIEPTTYALRMRRSTN